MPLSNKPDYSCLGPLPDQPRLSLDVNWILPKLALGGRIEMDAVEYLSQRLGIRRVVDLRAESADDPQMLERYGIVLLHLPTPDREPVSEEMIRLGVNWVAAALAQRKRVLIHCEYGIGRSALLACCVLVRQGYAPCEALLIAKQARSIVSPSPDQLHALIAWTTYWHRAQNRPCPQVSWDELAAIAYQRPSAAGGNGSDE